MVKQFPMNKIICLDETGNDSALKLTYTRCELGRKWVIKTSNQFVFYKFTLLAAISNSKCVGLNWLLHCICLVVLLYIIIIFNSIFDFYLK